MRNDLHDFRHLHPTLADDGTWTARVSLAGPGSHRVLAEFTPGENPEGGFDVETGAFAHAHPHGEPEVGDGGTDLTFHTEFAERGRYVFFVQVRVDGFVHTVPVGSTIS